MIVVGLTSIARTVIGPHRASADLYVADTLRDLPAGGTMGSVVATPDGDMLGATPIDALRQRVGRMLSNPAGAYAHLGQWGILVKRGKLMHFSALRIAQIQATQMLLEDPDIVDASVTFTQPTGAVRVLMASVSVKARFGGTFAASVVVGEVG